MAASVAKMVIPLVLFVVVAIPLVAFLWGSLNELLAWEIRTERLIITAVVLAVLAGVVSLWAKKARKL